MGQSTPTSWGPPRSLQPSSYAAISQSPRTHASAVQWKGHPAATGITFDRDQQGKSEPTEALFPVTFRFMESLVPLPLVIRSDLSYLAAKCGSWAPPKAGRPEKGNASSFPSGTSRGLASHSTDRCAHPLNPSCVSEKRVDLEGHNKNRCFTVATLTHPLL